MRLLRNISVAAFITVTLTASIQTTANAATMVLPEFTTKTGATGTAGADRLVTANGDEIKCRAATSQGTMEASKKLGTFVKTITGCKSERPVAGVECNSIGDAAETVLAVGTWHLVLTTISGVDKHLTWLLLAPLTVDCSLFEFKITGNVLAEVTPANTSTKKYHTKLDVVNGNQEFTNFENDGGENVAARFEVNSEVATVESAENVATAEQDTSIIN
jgi:hypothetical protein